MVIVKTDDRDEKKANIYLIFCSIWFSRIIVVSVSHSVMLVNVAKNIHSNRIPLTYTRARTQPPQQEKTKNDKEKP